MGSWGDKAFDNDAALDWVAELEAEGVSALRKILSNVADTHEDEYLDVDDGAPAIAAAEVVAAAIGRGLERVPKKVVAWIDANAGAIAEDDVELAKHAIKRVLAPSSELRSLREGDSAWQASVRELLTLLGGEPKARRATRRPQHEQSKTMLLTFLSARGLEPNAKEMARIHASTDGDEIRGWIARAVDAPTVAAVLGNERP